MARGLIRRAPGGFALTASGRAYIMSHRPDLVDEAAWSDKAGDLRDALSTKFEETGFPDYRTLPLGELSPRLRGELWNLGFIEKVTLARWQLTPRGQGWLLDNLAAERA